MRRLKKAVTIGSVACIASANGLILTSGHGKGLVHKKARRAKWMKNFILTDSAAEKLGSNIGKGSNFKNFGATGLSKLGKGVGKGLDKGLFKLGNGIEKGLDKGLFKLGNGIEKGLDKGLFKLGNGLDKGLSKLGNGIEKGLEKGLSSIGNAFFVAAAALVLWTEFCVLRACGIFTFFQLLFSLVALNVVVFGIAAIGILFFTRVDAMRKTKKTNDSATLSTSAGAKM